MTDSLSKTLQSKDMTVTAKAAHVQKILTCISGLRSDEHWSSIWQQCLHSAESMKVNQPVVPRFCRPPRKLDSDSDPVAETPESCYRRLFRELIDTAYNTIEARLNQNTLSILTDIEKLLLSTANDDVKDATTLDTVVLSFQRRHRQEETEATAGPIAGFIGSEKAPQIYKSLKDITDVIPKLGAASQCIVEVVKLIRLLLVVPTSSATAECSFSSLRRLKNYLRTTMTQQHLNSLLILHTHQDRTDGLDVVAVLPLPSVLLLSFLCPPSLPSVLYTAGCPV